MLIRAMNEALSPKRRLGERAWVRRAFVDTDPKRAPSPQPAPPTFAGGAGVNSVTPSARKEIGAC